MYTRDLETVIEIIAEYAPDLSAATKYFAWAETVVETLSCVYYKDVDHVDIMTALTEAVKEYQGWQDE